MKVEILEPVNQDLIEGYWFYERQSHGLGNYFLDSIFATIDSLRFFGGIHPRRLGHYRALSQKFPFAIFYQLEKNKVFVYAVVDCRRDPAWIRKRLKQPDSD